MNYKKATKQVKRQNRCLKRTTGATASTDVRWQGFIFPLAAVFLAHPDASATFGPLKTFLWGAVGRFGVEIAALYNELKSHHGQHIPPHLSTPSYWANCVLRIVCAGGFAVAQHASDPLHAIAMGLHCN